MSLLEGLKKKVNQKSAMERLEDSWRFISLRMKKKYKGKWKKYKK
jgi:hypothetical protein